MSMVLGIGRLYHSELMTFPKFLLFSSPSCQVKRAGPREGRYIGVLLRVSLAMWRRILSLHLDSAGKMGDVCQGCGGGECLQLGFVPAV